MAREVVAEVGGPDGTVTAAVVDDLPTVELVAAAGVRLASPRDGLPIAFLTTAEDVAGEDHRALPGLIGTLRARLGLPRLRASGVTTGDLLGTVLPLLDPALRDGRLVAPPHRVPDHVRHVLAPLSMRAAAEVLCAGGGTRAVARQLGSALLHTRSDREVRFAPVSAAWVAARAGAAPDQVAAVLAGVRVCVRPLSQARARVLVRLLATLRPRNVVQVLTSAGSSVDAWLALERTADLALRLDPDPLPRHVTDVQRLEEVVALRWAPAHAEVPCDVPADVGVVDGAVSPDGLRLVAARTVGDLLTVGRELDNCLVSRAHRYRHTGVLRVHARDGAVVGALEIDPRSGAVGPLLGRRNVVVEEHDVALRSWLVRCSPASVPPSPVIELARRVAAWGRAAEGDPGVPDELLTAAELERLHVGAAAADVPLLRWPWVVRTLRWAAADPRVPELPDERGPAPVAVEEARAVEELAPLTAVGRAAGSVEGRRRRLADLDLAGEGRRPEAARAVRWGLDLASDALGA